MENKYIRILNFQKRIVGKRLYAAVCLLLVASLLLTSTSFAWLNLSTAPEVSEVSTTIGSNGNLEIALGKNIAESAIGDSFDKNNITQANRTWGNLIDLTDESYGLQTITLRPAILNSAGGAINMLHPLAYPIYAADGRVQYIYANNMFAGTYSSGQFITTPNEYGVHGIGTTPYHAPGVEGTFGPLSQRQEIYYNAQNKLWEKSKSNYEAFCREYHDVLYAYCYYRKGVYAWEFDLNAFSQQFDEFVSVVNEELRLDFILLAAAETTSPENYFAAMAHLEETYPDYETIRPFVSSTSQSMGINNIGEAVAELRSFQNAAAHLKAVIASGDVDGSDGYSMEEIEQTVGLIFDLEKTSFTGKNFNGYYWSKVIPDFLYREYTVNIGASSYVEIYSEGLTILDITESMIKNKGQDNDSRESTLSEVRTHLYSLSNSVQLAELDQAVTDLYFDHWTYWDLCAEEYKLLQDEIADLESQIKQLENSGASESAITQKTAELSDKKTQLQSFTDNETLASDDDRIKTIQTIMTDNVETMRQHTIWSIALFACDGRVPDDAYHQILEIAESSENLKPRTLYQKLCNYGVTPPDNLTLMLEAYEKLETELLFLQKNSGAITWDKLNDELQRVFGTITHTFSFYVDAKTDSGFDSYRSSYSPENISAPTEVMATLREEIEAYQTALNKITYSNFGTGYNVQYGSYEENSLWSQSLGLLTSIYSIPDLSGNTNEEFVFENIHFSGTYDMHYVEDYWFGVSIGVGTEDNFNESGLTVRQTRFKDAQENISYYQNQLITAAVNPGKDMVALLMQIIADEDSVSLVTISEYLDSLQKQLEYGEAMMYQATLAMAASSYAEDDVYKRAYSDSAPENASGMIELLRNYNFDETVLNAFAHRMALLNNQKALLDRSQEALKVYQNQNTGELITEQISASDAVDLLGPVLDMDNLTLYAYIAKENSDKEDLPSYVNTVLYTGYGSPSVQIDGNQVTVASREPVTVSGNVYMSLGHSFSGGMLALAKSQTETYSPPSGELSANDIATFENGVNRYSYTIDTNEKLYTLNLRTDDAPYSLATDLWTYTGNTEYISADQTLVDIYGYSIDLSFRTNASNSDLLLQTEAVNRIYNDGKSQTDTAMGAGSYMEFEILNPSYSVEMAKQYMKCLRVVFTDTNTGYIYGYAALDMDAAEVIGVEIKAPLRLYDKDTGLMIEGDAAYFLCRLEQNMKKNLTVYVYLDGAKTSQSVVSSIGEQSLSGVMNLQFCSSADLKAADFDDLR